MSIVSINFKLKSEPKSSLKQFSTVKDAVHFVKSLKEDTIEYISLTDGHGYQVVGYGQIQVAYDRHSDLWSGDKFCIHPMTGSGHGGGQVCNTCKAWFCY